MYLLYICSLLLKSTYKKILTVALLISVNTTEMCSTYFKR